MTTKKTKKKGIPVRRSIKDPETFAGASEAFRNDFRLLRPGEGGGTASPFEEFTVEMHKILGSVASGKGYSAGDWENTNPTFEFIRDHVDKDHALGEIVYKVLRYRTRRNQIQHLSRSMEDLVKIAAWAFLEWRFGK